MWRHGLGTFVHDSSHSLIPSFLILPRQRKRSSLEFGGNDSIYFKNFSQLFIPPKNSRWSWFFIIFTLPNWAVRWSGTVMSCQRWWQHSSWSKRDKKKVEWVEFRNPGRRELWVWTTWKVERCSSKFNVNMMIHFSINPSKNNKIFPVVISSTVQS